MFQVAIDFSLFTSEAGAYAVIHGKLILEMVPMIGDHIQFLPQSCRDPPPAVGGYSGLLRVTGRVISTNSKGIAAALELEDVQVSNLTQAEALAQYLSTGFGFFVDKHDP